MCLADIALKNNINLLLVFVFISCVSKHKEYGENVSPYSFFPQEKELKGQIVELDTALFRYAFRVCVNGDKAIVMDMHGRDHFFHFFQYPRFLYLSSFGKRGDSPADMLSVGNVRFGDNVSWVLDANKSELSRFGLSLSGDSLLRNEVVTFDKEVLRSLDFVLYDDSTFIIPDYSGDNRFCWIDNNSTHIVRIGPRGEPEFKVSGGYGIPTGIRALVTFK